MILNVGRHVDQALRKGEAIGEVDQIDGTRHQHGIADVVAFDGDGRFLRNRSGVRFEHSQCRYPLEGEGR